MRWDDGANMQKQLATTEPSRMNEHSYSRRWNGINDPIHPLSRTAHSAVPHGRYIYILNGYGPTDNKMVLFDQVGLTRYDILTNCVEFLPVHWDIKSLQDHIFNESILLTSGNCAVLCPESFSTNSKHHPACIYTFGGYSLLGNIHINALCRIELTSSSDNDQLERKKLTSTGLQPHCCYASVVSGNGMLSCLSCLPQISSVHQSISLTMLRSFQRRLEHYHPANVYHGNNYKHCSSLVPTPRDKFCMEYWRGKLYLFGGYGPQFRPSATWPSQLFHWPYLHDPNDDTNWVMCDDNGGWNSQLITYDIMENHWELIAQHDVIGQFPTPRAAHCSVILFNHGWMIIFGGRGPYHHHRPNSCQPSVDFKMGRLNDMYCLNLNLMEWTRILTPLDMPQVLHRQPAIWPCGRSWMDMIIVHESLCPKDYSICYYDEKSEESDEANSLNMMMSMSDTTQLFLLGGWSNDDDALSDAYLININLCSKHKQLEAQITRSTEEVYTDTGSYSYPELRNNLVKQQYCFIEPVNNNSVTTGKPIVIDGYLCENQRKFPKFNISGNGEILSSEDLLPPYYSMNTIHTTELTKTSSIDNDSSSSGNNETENVNFFLNDLNYHLSMYQQSSFTVRHHYKRRKSINPKDPLYRIALLHTTFIQYLNENFCRYTVTTQNDNKNVNKTGQTDDTTDTLNSTDNSSRLIEELNNLCENYQLMLQPNQALILSLLTCNFLKLMLPWQMFQMFLQEENSWLKNHERLELMRKLIPQLSHIHKQQFPSSSVYSLDLSDPLIIDQLMLFIRPNKIHMPINYIGNGNQHLLHNLQQIITLAFMSFNNSPLHHVLNDSIKYSTLDLFTSSSLSTTIHTSNQPVHRHWHTVTLGLTGYIYVIGGTSHDALETPLECYHLHRPISLTIQCCMNIAKCIMSTFLHKMHNDAMKRVLLNDNLEERSLALNNNNNNNNTAVYPYSCHFIKNKSKINYLINIDRMLEYLLNNHARYLLEEWLL
ncbi:Kelch domain-containing protein isoform 1 [Schistosoma japonicum]|uniref:Kelch domain-containing protein isoform 1 n=2 Tax=Schistosoma japonicum TaxID=6182 RepID=A0A4Z2DPQ0_SCHJA|nr:Kelch domain-containing protein isoform 1 [Schistosoma japonicum]